MPPGLSAKTNSFDLQLYDKAAPSFSPFLTVQVAPLKLNGGSNNFSITDQLQPITDLDSVQSWFAGFYDATGPHDLSVRGTKAVISLGALHSQPRLDKTITVEGLNQLKGLAIQKLDFLFPPQNGNNLRGELMIPNPGKLALSIGDVVFRATSGDIEIGKLTVSGINIKPGNHTQSFEGNLDLQKIISNIGPFLSSQSNALGEGVVQLNATAESVTVDGNHVTFLEKVLATRPLSVNISIVTLLSDLISGLLSGTGSITGDGPNNGTELINVISNVFSNQTLLGGITNHWTKHRARSAEAGLESRSLLNDNAMWNMVKLGLKLKAMQKKQ